MAIGDFGNFGSGGSNYNANSSQNGGRKVFEPTYYSRLKQKTESMALSFTFRSGLLIFTLSKKVDNFKYDDLISIHLSVTKAKILAEQIKEFKKEYLSGKLVPGKAYGVNAGMNDKVTYIGFHTDENNKILVTIGKIDGTGAIIESHTTNLNKDYNFALEWKDITQMDVAKDYKDLIELDQIQELCADFGHYMNGALAYSVNDLARFENNKEAAKIDLIFDKLGIERPSYGQQRNYGSNNFINNSGRVESNHTSIDDLMNPPEDDE